MEIARHFSSSDSSHFQAAGAGDPRCRRHPIPPPSTFSSEPTHFLSEPSHLCAAMASYLQRLQAAAGVVLARDEAAEDHPPFDPEKVGVLAVLKPYQIEGVSWLVRRFVAGVNVILGDEMGLGKTLQAISLLSYLKFHHLSTGPFLVLCPLSVSDGWMSEFTKFCPSSKVLRYVGDKASRLELRRTVCEHVKQMHTSDGLGLPFDVLLTTYDIALMDQDFLSQIPWHYAVIDEAQRLKNSSSVLYQTLEQKFIMPRRLLLTGTPIQNNLTELWALLHFCMPLIFGAIEQFLSTFKEAGNLSTGYEGDEVNETLKVLRYVVSTFMLRRTKSMLVASGTLTLPPLTEITLMSPLVSLQKKVYLSILKKELPALLAASLGSSSHQSLQNIVIQLRKACSHPYLFTGIEPEPYEEGEHLVQASGKLIILDQLLQRLHSSGHRVLLFAQMTHTLDILQDFLELRSYTYDRLDGSIRAEERFAAIRGFSHKSTEEFNEEHAFVFLISTRAGGVGLNLIAADTVIFYEQDWNPQVDKQALQRAHRIGQTNHVLSINLVTARTVDEVIMRRAEKKLQLSLNVIGEEDNLHQGSKDMHAEFGNLRSLIVGFHMFDPTNRIGEEDTANVNFEKLEAMTDKVLQMRNDEPSVLDERKFEINSSDLLHEDHPTVARLDLSKCELDLDEESYRSWVEKLKEASGSIESVISEPARRRSLTETITIKPKVDKSKVEEKKLAQWEAIGYQSLAVKSPISIPDSDMVSDSGAVQFVYGDCTKPCSICSSEPAVVFSCIDDSGSWGNGGMFDALSNLSARIPEVYERAHECGDLRLGDLHLIEVEENKRGNNSENVPLWVALAVVQSYNHRRKVPRSDISIPHLEQCLLKASFSAAQNSASIHMPRIGYRSGSDRSEWYTAERLLRKYASLFGVKIFVYYYRRTTQI